ncbi:hypothetical protein XELAEV_18032307mg [Xenopus laevis]|uniref:Uncharacterized protein n=1 Tax=Xenopus laevis TaxID=8355 RepID=A0A974CRL2_XENLA|nr:hypothetical protein XELAEV_18032307mg [Xenopus laevis]
MVAARAESRPSKFVDGESGRSSQPEASHDLQIVCDSRAKPARLGPANVGPACTLLVAARAILICAQKGAFGQGPEKQTTTHLLSLHLYKRQKCSLFNLFSHFVIMVHLLP